MLIILLVSLLYPTMIKSSSYPAFRDHLNHSYILRPGNMTADYLANDTIDSCNMFGYTFQYLSPLEFDYSGIILKNDSNYAKRFNLKRMNPDETLNLWIEVENFLQPKVNLKIVGKVCSNNPCKDPAVLLWNKQPILCGQFGTKLSYVASLLISSYSLIIICRSKTRNNAASLVKLFAITSTCKLSYELIFVWYYKFKWNFNKKFY